MAKAHIENGQVHITTGRWSDTFPMAELDAKIVFYRRMVVKRPQNYQHTLDALMGLKETS